MDARDGLGLRPYFVRLERIDKILLERLRKKYDLKINNEVLSGSQKVSPKLKRPLQRRNRERRESEENLKKDSKSDRQEFLTKKERKAVKELKITVRPPPGSVGEKFPHKKVKRDERTKPRSSWSRRVRTEGRTNVAEYKCGREVITEAEPLKLRLFKAQPSADENRLPSKGSRTAVAEESARVKVEVAECDFKEEAKWGFGEWVAEETPSSSLTEVKSEAKSPEVFSELDAFTKKVKSEVAWPEEDSWTSVAGAAEEPKEEGDDSRDADEDDRETVIFEPSPAEVCEGGRTKGDKREEVVEAKQAATTESAQKTTKVQDKPACREEETTRFLEGERDALKEISCLVKLLYDKHKIIEQLVREMPDDAELAAHFKTVIDAQQEKFRQEIRKTQEVILRGYDRLLLACQNPKDVTLEISRKARLSVEEVQSVMSNCIQVESAFEVPRRPEAHLAGTVQGKAEGHASGLEAVVTHRQAPVPQPPNSTVFSSSLAQVPANPPHSAVVSYQPIRVRCPYFLAGDPASGQTPMGRLPAELLAADLLGKRLNPPVDYHPLRKAPTLRTNPLQNFRWAPQVIPPRELPSGVFFCELNPPPVTERLQRPLHPTHPAMGMTPQRVPFVDSSSGCVPHFPLGYPSANVPPTSHGPSVASGRAAPAHGRVFPPPFYRASGPFPRTSVPWLLNRPPGPNAEHGIWTPPDVGTVPRARQKAPGRKTKTVRPAMESGTFVPPPLQPTNVPSHQVGFPQPVPWNLRFDLLSQGRTEGPVGGVVVQQPNSDGSHGTTPSALQGSLNWSGEETRLRISSVEETPIEEQDFRPESSRKALDDEVKGLDPTIPQKLTMKNQRLQAGIQLPSERKIPAQDPRVHLNPGRGNGQSSTEAKARVYICAHEDCQKPGRVICEHCQSVIYCALGCKLKHWELKHKKECDKLKQLRT